MPFLAGQYAEQIGATPEELYSYQFALAPDAGEAIEGFSTRPFGARRLIHCPKLRVATLHDSVGGEIGYCLGVAVDNVGVAIEDGRTIGAAAGTGAFWPAVEDFAIGLAGRWLLLVTDGDASRIYGDASGMYNCVYDPVSGGVGSTLLMSLLRDIEETDEVDYTRTLSEGMRLPFGRTRDRHARRLAVNHYLTLDDWSETRFWPKPGTFAETAPGTEREVVAHIKDRLAAIFAGIVTAMPAAVGVSGGNDSRNLVAAGKATLGHVTRFFCHTHNFNSRTDYQSAVLMMRTLGHGVERHPAAPEPYTADEIAARNKRFQRSTGYCVGLHQMTNIKLDGSPRPGEVILTGHVMEALRGAHWMSTKQARRNALKFGLKRCLFVGGDRFDPEFVAQWLPVFRDWLRGLPRDAKEKYIDLVFPEHYLPNYGTILFGDQQNFGVAPFNDRRIIALCGQPVAYRFTNQANEVFLELAAPELIEVPFVTDLRRSKAAGEAVQAAPGAVFIRSAADI